LVTPPFYNENIPLRDLPPLINDVPGAMAIQELFDRIEWVQASNDAAAYAPHLALEPLATVPGKSILVLYAKGDMTAPNPRTTALVRAGVLRERTVFYRNDLAFAEDPAVPKDPHTFLQPVASPGITGQVARGGQTTVAEFLVSGGTSINRPQPARLFEFPIVIMGRITPTSSDPSGGKRIINAEMRKIMSKTRIFTGAIALGAMLASSGSGHAEQQFSARNLRGAYGFSGSGTLLGSPATVVGLTRFDGAGGCVTTARLNLASTIAPLISRSCSYSVNADGTGAQRVGVDVPGVGPATFVSEFGIAERSTEVQFMLRDESGLGTVATGVSKRQASDGD
jgi:hypothetical protein